MTSLSSGDNLLGDVSPGDFPFACGTPVRCRFGPAVAAPAISVTPTPGAQVAGGTGGVPLQLGQAVGGKRVVSSSRIKRGGNELGRTLWEGPVGCKWFAPGRFDGTCCFGGEESAGASFLRTDSTVWTTDKDGILLGLLAAEITANTGKDPGAHFA